MEKENGRNRVPVLILSGVHAALKEKEPLQHLSLYDVYKTIFYCIQRNEYEP